MHIVPLSSIIVPDNRQRREFLQENINELAESIRIHGLYHPIVCSPLADGRYNLVAGERRFRAILSLAELGLSFCCGNTTIPESHGAITLLSELDNLTLREIELEENTIRVDLTWAERAAAVAALHELRQEQAAVIGRVQTPSDTAKEVFGYTGAGTSMVTESLALTKAIAADPTLAKAKSHSEAVKILKKKSEAVRRQALGEAAINLSHTIHQGDSREVLLTLPDSTYQCIITDPPYGVGADGFGSQASTVHKYDDNLDYALDCYATLARESFRVAAEQAHAYVFCTIENFYTLTRYFADAGWDVWPRPLIWDKGNGMLPKPEYGPRYTYETILFANKGNRPLVLRGYPDVLSHTPAQDKIHAAETPVTLYNDLLSRSCYPGDTILDPFAGSGVVFLAAKSLKLTATGIELDPSFVAECKFRIAND